MNCCKPGWTDEKLCAMYNSVQLKFTQAAVLLPLWIVTYWATVKDVHDTQSVWQKSVAWLQQEEQKLVVHMTLSLECAQVYLGLLSVLGQTVALGNFSTVRTSS